MNHDAITIRDSTFRDYSRARTNAPKLEINSFYFILRVGKTIKQHETARSVVVLPCRMIAGGPSCQSIQCIVVSSSTRVKTTSSMSCNSCTMLQYSSSKTISPPSSSSSLSPSNSSNPSTTAGDPQSFHYCQPTVSYICRCSSVLCVIFVDGMCKTSFLFYWCERNGQNGKKQGRQERKEAYHRE